MLHAHVPPCVVGDVILTSGVKVPACPPLDHTYSQKGASAMLDILTKRFNATDSVASDSSPSGAAPPLRILFWASKSPTMVGGTWSDYSHLLAECGLLYVCQMEPNQDAVYNNVKAGGDYSFVKSYLHRSGVITPRDISTGTAS